MSVKQKVPRTKPKKKASSAKATNTKINKRQKEKERREKKAQALDVYYRNPSPVKGELNLKQREFCQLFVSHDRELFGNGTRCYLAVYGAEYFKIHGEKMEYAVANASAARLLANVSVINYINELLEEGGFNEVNVDKQLLFLINQNADPRAKLGAIKEFNNLMKRVDNRPAVITGNNINFGDFSKPSRQ